MNHPYADLIGLNIRKQDNGYSICSVETTEKLLNPHGVVHGAVLYSLADTGMGAALYPLLAGDELCATIEIKITYFAPVMTSVMECVTRLINKGKRVAYLESEITVDKSIVAKANGTYAIFKPTKHQ